MATNQTPGSFTVQQRIANSGSQYASEAAKFQAFKQNIMESLHVADLAVITAIDTSNNTITAKPIVNDILVDNTGAQQSVDNPEISDTPYVNGSPSVGAYCLLIYTDHDFSRVLDSTTGGLNASSGGPQSQNPQVRRLHSINHAVAILFQSSPSNTNVTPDANETTTPATGAGSLGVSESLITFIKSWEGMYLNWYYDSTGTATVGYGHTGPLPDGFTVPLTAETADQLLRTDLPPYIAAAQNIFSGFALTQSQLDAMVDFVWGYGPSALENSTLKKDILAHADPITLKKDFDAYSYSKGVFLTGLLRRQDANWKMFCYGQYVLNS